MDFLRFILTTYNEKFDEIFIYDCKCTHSQLSIEHIFENRMSFMACVKLNNRIHHKFFPIMVGCKYHLTKYPGIQNELKNSHGAFIINGELKILANILINNINLFYANKRQFLWNIAPRVQIVYKNGKVYQGSETNKSGKLTKSVEICENWRNLVPDPHQNHDEALYKLLFEEIRQNFPNIDHLSNKIVLTAPVLLEKVLQYLLTDEIKTKMATKKDLLTNGNITFIFSKQPFSRQSQKITNQMAIEKKNASIYISIDGHKVGRIKHFVTITKRMIPQESMNSQPLQYPIDGELFICMLSCKEMKDAGLTLNWAQGVTTTTQVHIPTETKNLLFFFSQYPGEMYLVVNCIIQPVKVQLTFETYVALKKQFRNCSVFKYPHFVHVLLVENVPIVCYRDIDNAYVYVTPNERTNIFPNELASKFKLEDHFCLLYNDLSPYTRHSLPTKITVSLNNWKGACYNISDTSLVEYTAFLESPGYNTGIISAGDYTHLAILSNQTLVDVPRNKFKPLSRIYDDTFHPEHGELMLYVAFTSRGECVEDGFIIDKELTERGPKLMVNVNFSVRLSSSTNQPLNARQLEKINIKYIPLNILVDKTIVFGEIIVYDQNIKIQQSKRINVTSSQINKQYIHTITHVIENPITTNYEIFSRENFESFSVICTYRYCVPIGKGTKLSNSYGQKSEISGVMDLGQYVGRRISDGALIKPQVLMGAISLVGRTPSGQIRDMLSSPHLAITARGELIAPQKFVCSSILSCTKIAPSPKRIDMLTGPNCFDGNELAVTNLVLNRQKNTQILAPQKLQRALNLVAVKGTTLGFKSNSSYDFNSFVTQKIN
jgi:hypothetical protein